MEFQSHLNNDSKRVRRAPGLCPIGDKTSYRLISQNLEGVSYGFYENFWYFTRQHGKFQSDTTIVIHNLATSRIRSGGRLNINMSSYQYRDPHVKDKTVSRPSYLKHGNPHTWKRWSLYWDGALVVGRLTALVNTPGLSKHVVKLSRPSNAYTMRKQTRPLLAQVMAYDVNQF